ncbi:hypothetical protein BT93_B1434 [Corymbia citriodora subsp. variegata]|nr:hypothetical protein BT93_B1434 [Corymbia citriodora subsp. variegata]
MQDNDPKHQEKKRKRLKPTLVPHSPIQLPFQRSHQSSVRPGEEVTNSIYVLQLQTKEQLLIILHISRITIIRVTSFRGRVNCIEISSKKPRLINSSRDHCELIPPLQAY